MFESRLSGDSLKIIMYTSDSIYRSNPVANIRFDCSAQAKQVSLLQRIDGFDMAVDEVGFFQFADRDS